MSSSAAGGDGPPPSGPGVVRPFSSRSSRSASRFGRQERQRAVNEQFQEEIQQLAEDLDVRVRERDPIGGPMEERPRSRLGSMFKSSGGAGDSSSATGGSAIEQKASELKETLTRPLSSLFRRSNSNDRSQPGPQHTTAANQASLPPAPARQVPTARGPLQSNSGSFGGAAVSSTVGSRRGPGDAAMGNGMVATIGANVNAAAAATTTTTATRPFSGFPGKRPAAAASLAQPQHQPGTESSGTAAAPQLETDLSEQAAIAPHVNVHRFSDLAGDASLFLPMSGQQPQSSVNAKGGSSQIDVNFLSRFLCPEDEIQDEQIPWTWDSLFASVTSELREEWALEEEANNEAVDTAGGAGIPIPNGTMQQQQQRYTQQKGF